LRGRGDLLAWFLLFPVQDRACPVRTGATEDAMLERIRHRFNPLHVYCRLMETGLREARARRLCALYEKIYAVIF
jgi:hypothetical protein